jgi:hypothetical protein
MLHDTLAVRSVSLFTYSSGLVLSKVSHEPATATVAAMTAYGRLQVSSIALLRMLITSAMLLLLLLQVACTYKARFELSSTNRSNCYAVLQ